MKIFRTKYKRINFWLDVVLIFAIMLAAAYFFFWPIRVGGHSMAPTMQEGSRLIASRFLAHFGNLSPGDFVLAQMGETIVVKRLAARPGDHFVLNADGVLLNGIRMDWPLNGDSAVDIDTVLDNGKYFLLGDNLLLSNDSRHFGPVENSHIIAKIVLRYFPLNAITLY